MDQLFSAVMMSLLKMPWEDSQIGPEKMTSSPSKINSTQPSSNAQHPVNAPINLPLDCLRLVVHSLLQVQVTPLLTQKTQSVFLQSSAMRLSKQQMDQSKYRVIMVRQVPVVESSMKAKSQKVQRLKKRMLNSRTFWKHWTSSKLKKEPWLPLTVHIALQRSVEVTKQLDCPPGVVLGGSKVQPTVTAIPGNQSVPLQPSAIKSSTLLMVLFSPPAMPSSRPQPLPLLLPSRLHLPLSPCEICFPVLI